MTLDTLGGYRIVRKLGDGPRAEIYLAYPERDQAESRAVAIKVYRPGVAETSIITEIESLSRAAGEHVMQLVDLATAPGGSIAVLVERVAGRSLGRLLHDRISLRVGEAITILAPLALALARMHRVGVVHGGIRLEAIAFDDAGAPVFTCFGRARLIDANMPPALLEAEQGVCDDLRAFESIAETVLDRVSVAPALPAMNPSGWLEDVAMALFTAGEAEPVRREPDFTPSALPARLVTGSPVDEAEAPRSSVFAALALPEWLTMPEWIDVGGLAERLAQLRGALARVRTRVWAIGVAVTLALVIALVVVPSPGPDATAQPTAAALAPVADVQASPVTGDDPLVALPVLLDARAECIRQLSVLCLDDVAQQGSAALAEDQQLVRDVQQGAVAADLWSVTASQLTLDERLGDSALVSLADVADSEPASILLMKGEAGWRIRDYLER